jgi:hypothetical protein
MSPGRSRDLTDTVTLPFFPVHHIAKLNGIVSKYKIQMERFDHIDVFFISVTSLVPPKVAPP